MNIIGIEKYKMQLANLPVIRKTGDFEKDTGAGYYRYARNRGYLENKFGISVTVEFTWDEDFKAYLLKEGVPAQYVDKVAYLAYEHGHSSGEEDILNYAYDLIELFK